MSDATKSDIYALQNEIRSLKSQINVLESKTDAKIDTISYKFCSKLSQLKMEMFLGGYFFFLALLLIVAIMVKH